MKNYSEDVFIYELINNFVYIRVFLYMCMCAAYIVLRALVVRIIKKRGRSVRKRQRKKKQTLSKAVRMFRKRVSVSEYEKDNITKREVL